MPDIETISDPATNETATNTEQPVRGSVVTEIDPNSALPPELHGINYVEDVWARIKAHPLRNPVLFRTKLDEDPESREIIRQVMSAGEQREHQILMHNQARVFRHILARVVAGVSAFLNEPLLPAFRETLLPKAAGDIPTNPPLIPKTRGIVSACIAWLLTPKYIGYAVLAFLGLATGWSQLEVYQLRKAVDAYKQSIGASDDLQKKMNEVVTSEAKSRTELQQQLTAAQTKAAELQSSLNQLNNDYLLAKKEIEFDAKKKTELQAALDDFKKNLKDDEKTTSDKMAALTSERDSLVKDKAQLLADKEILQNENNRLAASDQQLTFARENTVKERTEFNKQLSERNNRIAALLLTEALKIDAEACIESIRNSINSYSYRHESVVFAIQTYDTQKQTRVRDQQRRPNK